MADEAEKLYEKNRRDMMDEISQSQMEGSDDEGIKVSSVDEVMELLNQLEGISDAEKERMRLEIMKHQAYAQAHGGYMIKEQIADTRSSSDFLVFTAMISIIITIFEHYSIKMKDKLRYCEAPTYESILLDLNPLETLRKAIEGLTLDPDQKEYAYSLLEKIREIQETFELLSKAEQSIFNDELAENITGVVKNVKAKMSSNEIFRPQTDSYILPLVAVLILFSILVLFGYKLYKSLMEKQKKKAEKVKAKQAKKKK